MEIPKRVSSISAMQRKPNKSYTLYWFCDLIVFSNSLHCGSPEDNKHNFAFRTSSWCLENSRICVFLKKCPIFEATNFVFWEPQYFAIGYRMVQKNQGRNLMSNFNIFECFPAHRLCNFEKWKSDFGGFKIVLQILFFGNLHILPFATGWAKKSGSKSDE